MDCLQIIYNAQTTICNQRDERSMSFFPFLWKVKFVFELQMLCFYLIPLDCLQNIYNCKWFAGMQVCLHKRQFAISVTNDRCRFLHLSERWNWSLHCQCFVFILIHMDCLQNIYNCKWFAGMQVCLRKRQFAISVTNDRCRFLHLSERWNSSLHCKCFTFILISMDCLQNIYN